jgi:AcrR family transcriptional regulator
MEDVARAAGVGKGTLYEYFKDKKALFEGAFEVSVSGMFEEMRRHMDSKRPPLEILRNITHTTVSAMVEAGSDSYRFFMEYMFYASRSDDYGTLSELIVDYRQWITSLLESGIARGEIRAEIDPSRAAAAFAAWFDGAVFHWMISPDTVSLEAMADQFLEMTISGLECTVVGERKGAQ